ncbi:hypothetical protein GGR42_000837 [Saonia flava]|uniref:Uncharacterized protein n=1 Tax=Saonia flava TaxID=523696 RepID=A0A846QXK9_9FLAO|nr:hypothetical protein [Saonia flava]NJB70375.1 hypothetical protein [Saonia flava]
MGTHQVNKIDRETRAEFVRHLLSDIRALEIMLEKVLVETGITSKTSNLMDAITTNEFKQLLFSNKGFHYN